MAFYFSILFLSALLFGLAGLISPAINQKTYKLILVFGGSYLFAITIIHILPELYVSSSNPTLVGAYVLGGFFLQQLLEYFTSGAEHGHVHKPSDSHSHSSTSSILLLVALMVHSLLEGILLAHPSESHAHHESISLLMGIVLHKAPAAFALMSILLCYTKRSTAIIFLIIFALGSPIGMLTGDYFVENNLLSMDYFVMIFAVVSGNFLHISTTIVFESSADHKINTKKLAVALLGAFIAVGAEFFI